MKTALIIIGKLIATIAIMLIALFAYAYYEEYPARNFCNEIKKDMTPNEIIQKAKQKKLPFIDYLQRQNSVWVLNHESPFFRVACEVKFAEGKMLSKSIVGAD